MPQNFSLFENDTSHEILVNPKVRKELTEGLEDLMAQTLGRARTDIHRVAMEAAMQAGIARSKTVRRCW